MACGPGTAQDGGLCVSDGATSPTPSDGGLQCGPGTHAEGSQCLPGDPIDTITLSPGAVTLRARQEAQVTAAASFRGAAVSGAAFVYASDAPTIATVSATGRVTAVAPGVARVTAAAQGTTSAAVLVTVEPGPAYRIDSLAPAMGPPGTRVTLRGAAFGATAGSGSVRFGDATAEVLSWSDQAIVARVPWGTAAGPSSVRVVDPTGESNAVTFTVSADPYIGSVIPAGAAQGASVTLVVEGANLAECTPSLAT